MLTVNSTCEAFYTSGMDPERGYVCQINGSSWMKIVEAAPHVEIFAPPEMEDDTREGFRASECCAETSCWNGYDCIANQEQESLDITFGDDQRCIAGSWEDAVVKWTWRAI